MDPDSYKEAKLGSAHGDSEPDIDDATEGQKEEEKDEGVDDDDDAKEWDYIRVNGLGFVPGLCCPHHDRVQSNGVLRATDFDDMMLRHPTEVTFFFACAPYLYNAVVASRPRSCVVGRLCPPSFLAGRDMHRSQRRLRHRRVVLSRPTSDLGGLARFGLVRRILLRRETRQARRVDQGGPARRMHAPRAAMSGLRIDIPIAASAPRHRTERTEYEIGERRESRRRTDEDVVSWIRGQELLRRWRRLELHGRTRRIGRRRRRRRRRVGDGGDGGGETGVGGGAAGAVAARGLRGAMKEVAAAAAELLHLERR